MEQLQSHILLTTLKPLKSWRNYGHRIKKIVQISEQVSLQFLPGVGAVSEEKNLIKSQPKTAWTTKGKWTSEVHSYGLLVNIHYLSRLQKITIGSVESSCGQPLQITVWFQTAYRDVTRHRTVQSVPPLGRDESWKKFQCILSLGSSPPRPPAGPAIHAQLQRVGSWKLCLHQHLTSGDYDVTAFPVTSWYLTLLTT